MEEIENALKCLEMDMLDNTQIELLLNYIGELQKELEEKTTILMVGADKVKQLEKENKELNLENQALFESINCNDDNMLCRRYEKMKKIIDLMAEQMSKRPLMIFQGNEKENSVEILKEPKEIIDYYTKKAEE